MSRDLELIKQLDIEVEKETGEKLNKHSIYDKKRTLNYFAVDHDWNVISIGLFRIKKMSSILPIILKFQHLERLSIFDTRLKDISSLKELQGLTFLKLIRNQISDISGLLELKHLTVLDLSDNKITHLPAAALETGMEIKWEREYEENETGIFL
jgi:hypothetical protein